MSKENLEDSEMKESRYFSQIIERNKEWMGHKILPRRSFSPGIRGNSSVTKQSWAGEMVQQLGTFAAFGEDHSLVPSNHTGWLTTSDMQLSSRGSSAAFFRCTPMYTYLFPS